MLTLTQALAAGKNDYLDAATIAGVKVDLKYASSDNFMGKDVYGKWKKAYVHKEAFEKLAKAAKWLQKNHSGHQLLIYDALRPRSVQRKLWDHVKGTPEEMYVANPDKGSMHNYGLALDLTVVDTKGVPLDMGSGFDDFHEIAQPKFEERFLKEGALTEKHLKNRKILRHAMEHGGFTQLQHEWWHYDALPREEVKKRFTIVEDF